MCPSMENAGRDKPRTDTADIVGQSVNRSGWTTTDTAAKALEVSPRTVRRLIDRGELEGRKVREGIVEAWEVSIDSLYSLRDKRKAEGQVRRDVPRASDEADSAAVMGDIVRDLTADLVRASSEATELRVRLELTERAESSLREELQRERAKAEMLEAERVRREQAERERDELRRELEALQETPQASETVPEPLSDTYETPESTSEATEGMVTPADVGGVQAATQSPERRSWWRRFFGFE
jgi:excisionase family DNA binding protein